MKKNLQPKTKNLQPTSYNLQANSGFTLLEVIISISILTTGVIATIAFMNSELQQISYLKNKIIAINLAQEGIELVRNVRDNNLLNSKSFNVWIDGNANNCSSPCSYEIDYDDPKLSSSLDTKLKIDSNGFYQYNNGSDSIFTRKITITDISTNIGTGAVINVRVESEVSFGDKKVKLETILYDWK
ncbi:prepilin-type N-terminal cleavage/methylation domain-containing protein [Candidatus Azambacteria bacterium]|nr:prepilin-type N-terminal cleavage/methylation domain-containing protein [Candidatus Azambacteria bacterium]